MNNSIEPVNYTKIKLPSFAAAEHHHSSPPKQQERRTSQDDPVVVAARIFADKENSHNYAALTATQSSSSSSLSAGNVKILNNGLATANDSSQSLTESINIASGTPPAAPTPVESLSLSHTPTATSRLRLWAAPLSTNSQQTDTAALAASIPKKYRLLGDSTAIHPTPAVPVVSNSSADVASLSSSMRGINESMLRTPRLVQPMLKQSALQFCQNHNQQQQQQEAQQPNEEEFAEVLIENQRGWFLFGYPFFSANTLFPLDPAPWTCGPSGKTTAPGDISSFPLPAPDWEWVWTRWYIDMGYDVDDQGWSYSLNFGKSSRWHGSHVWFHSFVRRRRWIRLRRRILTTESGDEASVSFSSRAAATVPKYYMSPMCYFPVPQAQLQRETEAKTQIKKIGLGDCLEGDGNKSEVAEQLICTLREARLDRERIALVSRFFGLLSSTVRSKNNNSAEMMAVSVNTSVAEALVADFEFVKQLVDTFTYLDSKQKLVTLLSAEVHRLSLSQLSPNTDDANNNEESGVSSLKADAEGSELPGSVTDSGLAPLGTDDRRMSVLKSLVDTCTNIIKQEQYYNND